MKRTAAAIYGAYSMLAAVVLGFFFGLGLLPLVPIPRGRREKYGIAFARGWAWTVTRVVLMARPRVTGAIDKRRGALIICNHRSWLDPLLLMVYGSSNGLSKQEIAYIPFVGLYGWLSGAVYFDRKDRSQRARARREVMMLVENGFRIQLFPEGTRSRDGRLRKKVHLTLVRDCWEAGVPVVPAAVMDTDKVLPPTHFSAYVLQQPRLHFAEPLHPSDYPDDKAFAEAAWARVVEEVDRLRSEVSRT